MAHTLISIRGSVLRREGGDSRTSSFFQPTCWMASVMVASEGGSFTRPLAPKPQRSTKGEIVTSKAPLVSLLSSSENFNMSASSLGTVIQSVLRLALKRVAGESFQLVIAD